MIEERLQLIPLPDLAEHDRIDIYSGIQRLNPRVYGNLTRQTGSARRTVLILLHPTSNFLAHPLLPELATAGLDALGIATRYVGNDSTLIMENVLLDVGAAVRWVRERLGYQRVVLVGWSGGASVACYYQSQATAPTVRCTPAGDPPDLTRADLPPADAVISLAGHASRARTLLESLDPAVVDESDPYATEPEWDLYSGAHGPPFAPEWLAGYRERQAARMDRITAWVRQQLAALPDGIADRAFLVHRTMADPRWLDPSLDPNERPPYRCLHGDPRRANYLPVGLARYTSLRSWLSQWSVRDSHADAVQHASRLTVPVLVVVHGADEACPPSHAHELFAAVAHSRKQLLTIPGANHYYAGQPAQQQLAAKSLREWLDSEDLL